MQKYLNYIKNNYGEFRYFSDKNVLENLDKFQEIDYKIISNEIGFCLVFVDKRISSEIGFFGFLEIYKKNDFKIFFKIIQDYFSSKNIKTLIGPINISIWNSYRFFNNNHNKIILGEYENDTYLHKLLLENGFNIYENYITAKRIGKNPYVLKGDYSDFEIKKAEANKNTIKDIFLLSEKIFTNAPKISFEEFEIFMKIYLDLYKKNTQEFFINYKGEKIGFLSSFYNDKYFVIKTVGILKEFRGKGLGNYLLNFVYKYFYDLGFLESYYLYMRENGDALKMTDENASLYRQYNTFYKKL